MSAIDNTTREWRAETSAERRGELGKIRRMVVALSSGVFWQTVGHLLFDNVTHETRDAEVFSGVGFYSRPKAGHNTEAVVVFAGGSSNPIIIATRDEDARKAIANLAEDESAVFNSSTIIIVKANGTVEIRSATGTALSLATKADLDALAGKVSGHVHQVVCPSGGGTVVSAAATGSTPAALGTTVLKAQ